MIDKKLSKKAKKIDRFLINFFKKKKKILISQTNEVRNYFRWKKN